jgi:cytoskeletal protein CcmA (bactofilin family)
MADVTVIGRGANVVGTVSGAVDLTVHGRIEGAVAVDGDVTIEADGLVAASVSGHHVVVRGAVKGDVTGEEAIRLEEGARVAGDLRAPRIAITRGALVRGYVQTGGAAGAGESAGRTQARAAAPVRRAPPPSPSRTAPAPAAPSESNAAARHAPTPTLLAGGTPAAPKGPPPPVVPALRKGAKGTLKKRAI